MEPVHVSGSALVMQSIKSFKFALVCLCLTVGKLVLVSQNEILAMPDDSAAYARQALAKWSLGIPPGYPVWLSICALSGVPQRICIEALYLLAAFMLAAVTRRCFGMFAGCLIFSMLAFSPFTYFLFDRGLSDGFFTCLTLLAIAFSMHILTGGSVGETTARALALGAILGVMAITRNEDPLLALWVCLLVVALALTKDRNSVSLLTWRAWIKPLSAGMAAALSCGIVVGTLCASYYFVDGVFARGIAIMPQYSKLLHNLAQIDTGQAQIRFVPISRGSREFAYRVSPTLLTLRSRIEDEQDVWHTASRESGLPSGEIGAGWIWHAVNSKMLPSVGNSRLAAEAAYKKANAEIGKAFHDGRLKKRFIIHPLIGGDLAGLLRQFPSSLLKIASSAFDSLTDYAQDDGVESQLFDKVFLRRSSLIEDVPAVTVQGWALVFSPGRKIAKIAITSTLSADAPIVSIDRPDVAKGFFAQSGWKPDVAGFKAEVKSRSPEDVGVNYVLDDGSRLQATHLKGMQVTKIVNKSMGHGDVLQGIDLVAGRISNRIGPFYQLQRRLVALSNLKTSHRVFIAIFALACMSLPAASILGDRSVRVRLLAVLLGFYFAAWCARVVFYSLIDAAAWNANQVRYLAPANALEVVMVALSIVAVFNLALGAVTGFPKKH